MHDARKLRFWSWLAFVLLVLFAQPALAQSPDEPTADVGPQTLWSIVHSAGWIGYTILALSVATAALVIEQALVLRRSVQAPKGLADEVRQALAAGRASAALERCRKEDGLLPGMLAAGIDELDAGWPAIEKSLEDAAAAGSARLLRRLDYLQVSANLATLLGLLGTVVGLIVAFRRVAETQGAARAAELAGGIYLALVTTVEGLAVAIPALAAFAVLRNRLDLLVAESAREALQVFRPWKRSASRRPPPPSLGR